MFSQFIKVSRSRTEIYPLVGAVTFALGMGTVFSAKHLLFNPDIKVNRTTRSNPPTLKSSDWYKL